MKKNRIILLLVVSIFVLCILLTYYLFRKKDIEDNDFIYDENTVEDIIENDIENIESDTIESNNGEQENQESSQKKSLDVYDDDLYEEFEPVKEENLILEKENDKSSYFIIKYCLSNFYSSKENAYNSLDYKERNYDINNFYDEGTSFCIDEIYKASIKNSKIIYYVYYRISKGEKNTINKQIMIKIDSSNAAFYIYPYEYLKSINYTDLKDGDKISLDVVDDTEIKRTKYNQYSLMKIKYDEPTCIKELFARFEFDVKYDLIHLYNSLDEEYKTIRFENNFEKFTNFMNNRRQVYTEDIINGYQKYELNWYTQYIIICFNDDNFVINMVDLMNYSIQLDYYTTALPAYSELYNSMFIHIRPKYCMDRIRKAINDENYEFIYQKLDEVQKSNYFKNFDDFVTYIKQNFYQKNIFEYGKYKKVSDLVYMYDVKVKDESNESIYRTFKMTVTLNAESEDFTISISS